jgi:hypothetical protein
MPNFSGNFAVSFGLLLPKIGQATMALRCRLFRGDSSVVRHMLTSVFCAMAMADCTLNQTNGGLGESDWHLLLPTSTCFKKPRVDNVVQAYPFHVSVGLSYFL